MKDPTSPETVAAATLAALVELPFATRAQALRKAGNCSAALDLLPHRDSDRDAARRRLQGIVAAGFRPIGWSDPDYPRLLRAIHDPPFVLSVWGELDDEDALSISVVGSRRASRYGLEMSDRLAHDLASAGLTIVSGLARGIDAAAHRGALRAGGRTLAVLGSGLSRLYPREHSELAERVAGSGAVISELALDEPPRPANFPRRNRIITGMTLGTLVVEAARKSGSLVSARSALQQNRDVYAVPGPALSPGSEGVHALLRDGATLVTRAEDVLDDLRPDVRALLRPRPERDSSQGESEPSDEDERAVLAVLRDALEPVDLDAILARRPLPAPRALAALARLQVKSLAWTLGGGLFQAAPREEGEKTRLVGPV